VTVWLTARLAEVTPDLAGAVVDLFERAAPGMWGPSRMAEAALDGLERVAAGGRDRDRALELLAADALLTYAFEAAADPAIGGSARAAAALAERFGPAGELGRCCARDRT